MPPLRAAGQPGGGRRPGARGAAAGPRRPSTRSARQHRTVTTRSIDHAYEEAVGAAADGRDGGRARRRRPAPPARRRAQGHRTRARDRPLRPRQRLRARARHPDGPGRGGAASRSRARSACVDVANVEGTPFMGIASFGFDSDANRIANEAKLVKGNAVYLYAALRALAAWKPAALQRDRRRRAPRVHRVLGRRRQLEGLRRRHVRPPPGRARRRQARRDARRRTPRSSASCASCPRSSRARTRTRSSSSSSAARRSR